jgi:hypothetical protein
MRQTIPSSLAALMLLMVCGPQPASAQFTQQGAKLVGSGATGMADQGLSVALSADGTTAILGGPYDNSSVGAAWIFVQSGGVWAQQGPKLVGSGAVGQAFQGVAVALSGDGDTAIVGGYTDNTDDGAAWVFTRSGGVWAQQGGKLVGTGAVGHAFQGYSVALSSDGNTAIVGGTGDNSDDGAAWVFTRSGGVWTQQGGKLVGSGAVGQAHQGTSVAMSADGNTVIIGGPDDSSNLGAAWVFTRSGGVWTQQGGKLVGAGAFGGAFQGRSVSVSGDGNTAVLGGPHDNSNAGAAWVFTRSGGAWAQQAALVGTGAVGAAQQGWSVALSAAGNTAVVSGFADDANGGAAWVFIRSGGVWTQLGPKLVGTGAVGAAEQGNSVALSGDGGTLLVGGGLDNVDAGAAWVFVRTTQPNTHDFNGDGMSDIAWRGSSGGTAAWLMSGGAPIGAGGLGTVPTTWQIVGQRDFNGDGRSDWLWRDSATGTVAIWLLNGLQVIQSGTIGVVPTNWTVAGTGDFNGDGLGDILWRDGTTGAVELWLMNGLSVLSTASLGAVPTNWTIAGIGDFNGDGMSDILWRDGASGTVEIWLLDGMLILQDGAPGAVPANWSIVGTGDFNGDGKADILWRDSTTGTVVIWLMNGFLIEQTGNLGAVPLNWTVQETGDFNGDGSSDILWQDTAGDTAIWFMNGVQVAASASLGAVSTAWSIQGLNAD